MAAATALDLLIVTLVLALMFVATLRSTSTANLHAWCRKGLPDPPMCIYFVATVFCVGLTA